MNISRLFVLSSLMLTAGCVYYLPPAPQMSSTQVSPNVEIIGTVEGKGESLEAALQDALSKRGGDTLINVSVDQATHYIILPLPPFYFPTKIETEVMGTSVKFPK